MAGQGPITPELERWVLWHLAIDRLLQYLHCRHRQGDLWTVPEDGTTQTLTERVASTLTVLCEQPCEFQS